MATWPEARAAKDNRLRREARYFTPDLRGPMCPICKTPTSKKLVETTGLPTHPCCDPGARV